MKADQAKLVASRVNVKPVATRLVLNFPGFEQTGPIHQLGRIAHSAEKTGEIWAFDYERVSAEEAGEAHHATSLHRANGANWQVETRLIQFSWNDVIREYEKERFPLGLIKNLPKYLAFFFDGTVYRYFKASPRYWGFTIYPLLALILFAAIAGAIAFWLLPLFGLASPLLTVPFFLALILLFCRWPGKRWYMSLTIDDWGFARDMVKRDNKAIEARFEEFAETLGEEIAASDHDEILIVGHSFGAVWAVAALAIALEKSPELLKGKPVTFLALGSSILKIALAPDAGFMREYVGRVIAEPDLFWHEIQTKDDLIAFYKADPFEAMGIEHRRAVIRIDRVKYKKAMDKKRYRTMRKSFYRTHRQYILYQDKRVVYDTLLRFFGPLSARQLAFLPEAEKRIDPTGKLV